MWEYVWNVGCPLEKQHVYTMTAYSKSRVMLHLMCYFLLQLLSLNWDLDKLLIRILVVQMCYRYKLKLCCTKEAKQEKLKTLLSATVTVPVVSSSGVNFVKCRHMLVTRITVNASLKHELFKQSYCELFSSCKIWIKHSHRMSLCSSFFFIKLHHFW